MCGHIVSLITAKHGHRDIAILHETAAMQSAVEAVTTAVRRVRSFVVGSVTRPLAQQS
jgi:hypothetical protein